ncbi:hypothetical protein [Desertibaculum subflavum]|uniref:hypothetical protein n=1 Tax=Desertibaculum subflavum TaxID=2268458 RepID=UPI000E66BD1E
MWRRIVVFFVVYLFGFMIGLPAVVLYFVQSEIGPLQWPPPPAFSFDPAWTVQSGSFVDAARLLAADRQVADLRQILTQADAAAASVNADGTLAAAARFRDAGRTEYGIATLLAQYGVTRRERLAVGERITAREGMTGLLLRDPTRLLVVLGFQPGAAERRLARMPGLNLVPNPAARKVPSKRQLMLVGAGVFGWALLQFFIFGRAASWVATTSAAPGVAPVSAAVLEQRLMALNGRDLPFTVTRGTRPNEILVDWRYADAKWFDLMRVAGLRRTFRLTLRLDERRHAARAMDSTVDLGWSASAGGVDFRYRRNWGITFFAYERGGVLGFQFKHGRPTLDPAYTWRFNLNELRGPVAEVVTGSGWRYQPVITFFRPVGG